MGAPMPSTKYDRLLEQAARGTPVSAAVAHPCEQSVLEAVAEAARRKLLTPVLVGPAPKIREVAGVDWDKLQQAWEFCSAVEGANQLLVIRRGHVVGETTPAQATERSLAEMMVGRSVLLEVEKQPAQPGDVVLELRSVCADDDRGQRIVNHVSVEVRAGEILGIAGVQGNGQTELVEVCTGLRHVREGHVLIDQQDCTNASPRKITEAGTAHVPEDRQKHGLLLNFPLSDNFVLCNYYLPPFAFVSSYDSRIP